MGNCCCSLNRNTTKKCTIYVLTSLGIFLTTFASANCRWYALPEPELATSGWDFLPPAAYDQQQEFLTIGMYKYQNPLEGGSCVPYTRSLLWRGPNGIYSWMFTSQLCVVLGPVVASMALVALFCGRSLCLLTTKQKRWMACCLLLLASGLQWASIVSSIAWCGNLTSCDWLVGANMNVGGAFLFTMSWAIAVCCFDHRSNDEEDDGNDDGINNNNGRRALDIEEELGVAKKLNDDGSMKTNIIGGDLEDGDLVNVDLEEHKPSSSSSSSLPTHKHVRKGSLLARELLGTNDPIIFNAVGQRAMTIREFAQSQPRYDGSDDDDDDHHDTDEEA